MKEASRASLLRCLDNRSLQLILMPTEACNLRCVYCFESGQGGRMQAAVTQGVKALLTRRAGSLRNLGLSWYGGEPLVAHDIITEIMGHARSLVRSHEGLSLHSNMVTNAFLLSSRLFRHLLRLGVVDYQITLDGPRHLHDRKRTLPGGGGTFERIWGNLVSIRNVDGDFRILVRLHVDRENQAALPAFIDEYDRVFGSDSRFELFVRPISRMGHARDGCLPVLEGQEARRVVRGLEEHMARRGMRRIKIGGELAVCHAVRVNAIIVRADGRLSKCAVDLDHPANQVGRLGADGRVELSMPKMRFWMRGLASGDGTDLSCPVLGLKEGERVVNA